MRAKYKRFDKELPEMKKDKGNAGYDLYARLEEPVTIGPGAVARIPLNIATEIPEGYVGFLLQRSSTYRKWGVRLTNNVGTIDSSYSGDMDEWVAEFQNMKNFAVTIEDGDKVCQAVFIKLAELGFEETDELGNEDRGGFGTSGFSAYGEES